MRVLISMSNGLDFISEIVFDGLTEGPNKIEKYRILALKEECKCEVMNIHCLEKNQTGQQVISEDYSVGFWSL